MNPIPPAQKPKVDNNALFSQRLIDTPPEYNLGESVKFVFKKGTITNVGFITGRVYNENEKNWKYTVKPYSLDTNYDDVMIIQRM